MQAFEHSQQIQDLWSSQIGTNQNRIDLVAVHLVQAAAANPKRPSFGLPRPR
jgi:hypothetical protein